jgi:hypothetical protein
MKNVSMPVDTRTRERPERASQTPTRLPRWLATSPHGTWLGSDTASVWVPYSAPHARQVGSALTACREFAVGWPLLWDIPFDTDAPDVCQECVVAIRHAPSSL